MLLGGDGHIIKMQKGFGSDKQPLTLKTVCNYLLGDLRGFFEPVVEEIFLQVSLLSSV